VNVTKLQKTLVKEFKRSPAKSIVLILLCPVALYFITPVVRGMLPKSNKPASAAVADVPAEAASFLLRTTEPAEVEPEKTNWREVAKWLESDQLSKPVHAFTADRSPFVDLVEAEPEVEEEDIEQEQVAQPKPKTVHDIFKEGHLQLTMTMLGRQRRLATINGKVFAEGDVVPVEVKSGSGKPELFNLTLKQVDRRSVELTFNAETFQIELPERTPADAIVIRRAKK
jgi:ABC-type ATPase with predicted acetyltransferase domain